MKFEGEESAVVAKCMEEMNRALRLVLSLHDHPEANAPGYKVKLDPKAEEQVRHAIRRYEYVVQPEIKEQVPEAFNDK